MTHVTSAIEEMYSQPLLIAVKWVQGKHFPSSKSFNLWKVTHFANFWAYYPVKKWESQKNNRFRPDCLSDDAWRLKHGAISFVVFRNASVLGQIFLQAVVEELGRTGREITSFDAVFSDFVKMAVFEGMNLCFFAPILSEEGWNKNFHFLQVISSQQFLKVCLSLTNFLPLDSCLERAMDEDFGKGCSWISVQMTCCLRWIGWMETELLLEFLLFPDVINFFLQKDDYKTIFGLQAAF